MNAVINGDIVNSGCLVDQSEWSTPLTEFLQGTISNRNLWEIAWGDSFQLVVDTKESLLVALKIKSLIKKINFNQFCEKGSKDKKVDVRLAIGIGPTGETDQNVKLMYGDAFTRAGNLIATLKKSNQKMALESNQKSFDENINLTLRLLSVVLDSWSRSSAELAYIVLSNPGLTQSEIGDKLNITQGAVSSRWSRAQIDLVIDVEKHFKKIVNQTFY